MLRVKFVAFAVAIITLGTLGPSIRGGAAESQLVIATGNEVTSLDPHTTDDTESQNARFMVYETLLRYTGGPQFKPGLAMSWTVNDRGMKYRFNLRKGVRFHDGTLFLPVLVSNPGPDYKGDCNQA